MEWSASQLTKAKAAVLSGLVTRIKDTGLMTVPSMDGRRSYDVTLFGVDGNYYSARCTCAAGSHARNCYHVAAALLAIKTDRYLERPNPNDKPEDHPLDSLFAELEQALNHGGR